MHKTIALFVREGGGKWCALNVDMPRSELEKIRLGWASINYFNDAQFMIDTYSMNDRSWTGYVTP